MRRETFNPLIASVGGGIAIPCLYVLGLAALAITIRLLGLHLPGEYFDFLCTPMTWAGVLYNYLFPPKSEIVYGLLRKEVFIASVVGDFLLYTILTYLFLRVRSNNRLILK